jgi:hypothetical protein
MERPSILSSVTDTPARRAAAIRSLVKVTVRSMVSYGTAIKRTDARYAVGPRKPKSYFPDEVTDVDGTITRKQVAVMELVRVARPVVARIEALEAQGNHHLPGISVALGRALKRLVAAYSQGLTEEQQARVEGGRAAIVRGDYVTLDELHQRSE